MLCGAKATITAFSNANALVADPVGYVLRSTPPVYDALDITSQAFLAVNKENFQIAWRDVEAISFDPAKKSGLGFLPQAGAITFLGRSGKKIELVLLGFQDGETLTSRLRRSVDDKRQP
jgi:hypothetical protein